MCADAEGRGNRSPTSDLSVILDESKSLTERCHSSCRGYTADGWDGGDRSSESGFFEPQEADQGLTPRRNAHDLLYKQTTRDQGQGHQRLLRRADPEAPQVDVSARTWTRLQPTKRRFVERARGLQDLSRSAMATRRSTRRRVSFEDRRALSSPTGAPCRSPTRPSGLRGNRRGGRGRPLVANLLHLFRLVRRESASATCSLDRPSGTAVRGRGAADQDGAAHRVPR